MDQGWFIPSAIVAFLLIIVGFVVRGMSRALIDGQTGDLLAAPLIGVGFLMIVGLTVVSVLGWAGFGPLADADSP